LDLEGAIKFWAQHLGLAVLGAWHGAAFRGQVSIFPWGETTHQAPLFVSSLLPFSRENQSFLSLSFYIGNSSHELINVIHFLLIPKYNST
jgi:hypothetical protein